jgi:hypothetical protein
MMPRAPPTVGPPLVLRPNWKTLARLASRRSKPLDPDACPTPKHPPVSFVVQPTNQAPLGFEAQTKIPSWWFWGPNHQTRAARFVAQTGKLSTLILRLNQETHAPRLHVHGADRTQRHRVPDLWDHSRSSALGLLLLPRSSSLHAMLHLPLTHHETSKRDSPNEHEGRIEPQKCPGFEFKPRHVNDSSHIKPRHWPLGFSIFPLMSPLTTKAQSLKFESKTPWSTARRPKSQEKLKKVI